MPGQKISMSWLRRKWDGKIPEPWPSFSGGKVALARWTHPEGKKRVYLIQRPDKRFSKWSEEFSEEEFEMCWLPLERGGSLYDSESTAEENIALEYPWTRTVAKENKQ